ncbi:interferon-induced protein 44-like [Acanthopagrus schlegelii]
MGGRQSKSGAPPALLSKPWREMNWGDTQSTLQYLKNYKPLNEGQQLRILLHGPDGAGKSSFINSVQSIFRGRMYVQALADNTSGSSFTKMYTTYKIPKNNSHSFFPFVFNDIMGLEPKNGVLVDDVKLAMRGHMKEGYRFNPESKLSEYDKFYNDTPADNDKVHVLVCVIPADAISRMAEETVQKIRDIRKEASDLRIPQVVIITKIDDICHEISEDLKNVYKVQYVREKMEQFSVDVGIPMNCIFPVKNYKSEISLNNDTDILLLCALKNIINFGEDYVNFRKSQSEFRQK